MEEAAAVGPRGTIGPGPPPWISSLPGRSLIHAGNAFFF